MANPLFVWRSKRGLTMRELAEKSEVGLSTINRIEQGTPAYASTIGKLAKALEVDYSELESLAIPKTEKSPGN